MLGSKTPRCGARRTAYTHSSHRLTCQGAAHAGHTLVRNAIATGRDTAHGHDGLRELLGVDVILQRHDLRLLELDRVEDCIFFFFQAEDGIRDLTVTGVQTCALPI